MNNKKIIIVPLVAMSLLLSACNIGGGSGGNNSQSGGDVISTSKSDADEGDVYSVETPTGKLAEGMMDYSQLDWEERSKILAQLEYYALRNHTAGIPLYDDASYEQFSSRVSLPSAKYLTNYGFGTSYGRIDGSKDMYNGPINESNAKWKNYFHGYTNTDSGTFNGWNSTGSDVTDRVSMISSGYFGVKANADNTAYSWVGSLSQEDAPIMLNSKGEVVEADSDGYITQTQADGTVKKVKYEEATSQYWRVKVKTGSDLVYHTADVSKWKSKYDGKTVKLEDYLTPFKAMLLSNMARTSELVSDTSGFQGAMDFFYKSDKTSYLNNWANSGVGIQLNEKESAIEFKFIQPKSVSYARTSLSSSLYSPLPQEFIEDLGGGSFTSGSTTYGTIAPSKSGDYTDVFDNILVLGAYIPEYWQQNSRIVYRANTDYFEASDFHYEGYSEVIFKGNDPDEQAYTAFQNNELDEVTIPMSQLSHRNDANVLRTEGSTVIKLNLNTTTDEEWEGYFGENGTITTHKKSDYWNTQAIMSNDDFLDGLYFAINRKELADQAGRNPATSYLSKAYMLDPAGEVSYRDSKYGKGVLKNFEKAAGNEYCYSRSLAEQYFKRAGDAMINEGYYSSGSTITIVGVYRYQKTIDNLGSYIKSYIEDAFNEANKSNNLKLNLKLEVGGTQYTDTYTKMDNGEFDIAEGAISGNVLNPLEFMNTLSTNKALNSGFCLNWGHRTDKLHDEGSKDRYAATYGGRDFSYDALWNASQGITAVMEGESTAVGQNPELTYDEKNKEVVFKCEFPSIATDDEGNSLYDFEIKDAAILTCDSATLNYTSGGGYYTDKYGDLEVDGDGYLKFTVPTSEIKTIAKRIASSTSKTQKYFFLYFSLVYSITLDSGTITKSVIMDVPGALADFGIGDVNP